MWLRRFSAKRGASPVLLRLTTPAARDDVLDLIGPAGPFMTLQEQEGEKTLIRLTLGALLAAIDEAKARYHPAWIPHLSWVADQHLELHPEDGAVVNAHLIRAGLEESVTEESDG